MPRIIGQSRWERCNHKSDGCNHKSEGCNHKNLQPATKSEKCNAKTFGANLPYPVM
jgi:hypothetical protein